MYYILILLSFKLCARFMCDLPTMMTLEYSEFIFIFTTEIYILSYVFLLLISTFFSLKNLLLVLKTYFWHDQSSGHELLQFFLFGKLIFCP